MCIYIYFYSNLDGINTYDKIEIVYTLRTKLIVEKELSGTKLNMIPNLRMEKILVPL